MGMSEKLSRLRGFLDYVGGHYQMRVDGLSGPSITKLESLTDTGRPFMSVTARMNRAILDEWKRQAGKLLSKNMHALNLEPALDAMSRAAKAVVVQRFEDGGFDIRLQALSDPYARFKARMGWDPRIGIATGVLLRNLQRARWYMEKVSSR